MKPKPTIKTYTQGELIQLLILLQKLDWHWCNGDLPTDLRMVPAAPLGITLFNDAKTIRFVTPEYWDDVDYRTYNLADTALSLLLPSNPVVARVKINEEHTAIVYPDHVVVGCTTVTADIVKKIASHL